jgi:hypothetical protein
VGPRVVLEENGAGIEKRHGREKPRFCWGFTAENS